MAYNCFKSVKRANSLTIESPQVIESSTVERHVFASGLKVYISQGDLIYQRTDAIVSPTNSSLNHNGGAAKIIAKAAGKALIEECENYIKKRQCLPVTKVMHTTAGNLTSTIKYVIHAVGPNALQLTMDQSSEQLYPMMVETFLNCFKYANDKLLISSIAVPAISAGNQGAPIEVVGSAMFKAVEIFESSRIKEMKRKTLKEIHFVNIDKPTVESICEAFRSWSKGCDIGCRKSADGYDRQNGQSSPVRANDDFFKNPLSDGKYKNKPLAKEGSTSRRKSNESEKASATRSNSEKPKEKTQKEIGYEESVTSTYSVVNWKENDKDIPMEVDDDVTTFHEIPEKDHKKIFPSDHRTRCDDATASTSNPKEKVEKDVCPICMDEIAHPRKLKCGHAFCKDCLKEYNKRCNPKCPTCGMIYGDMKGNQPRGTKEVAEMNLSLPGYEMCSTLRINFCIADGVQDKRHPNPGKAFKGTQRTAYLPNNEEGGQVAEMLTRAFDNKLLFTVGRSHTTGRDDGIIWNDIHLKTSICGTYGYPDPGYLKRVKEELADKGIHPQEQDEFI